jgi:hypothetical protein
MHPWVGYDKRISIQNRVTIEQNIQIEHPGAPANPISPATRLMLHALQLFQKPWRWQAGIDPAYRVYEIRLIEVSNRRRAIKGRTIPESSAGNLFEFIDRVADILDRVSLVAT